MIKRTLLFLTLCSVLSIGALGQQSCTLPNGKTSTKLACQIPVVTRANYPGTIGNPAAAFSSSFATQLGQLPVLSSGSGVVLTLDRTLGVYVASENLGPILTDRAQTIGKHKLLLAFAFQRFIFNSIDGTSLSKVPFVYAASSGTVNPKKPCTIIDPSSSLICLTQTDSIGMNLNQYVGLATFGLDSKTDVSVVIPFARVSLGVAVGMNHGTEYFITGNNTLQGPPLPFNSCAPGLRNCVVPGSASGIGDVLISAKRLLWSGSDEKMHLSAGILIRFPTGDALNYLGSGAYGFDPYAVFAYQAKRISPHVRLGYQFNTSTVLIPTYSKTDPNHFTGYSDLPGGFQYDFGADAVLFKKIPTTVAGDFLGNYIVNAPVLVPGTVQIPAVSNNFSVPTLNPVTNSYNSAQLSVGLKVKPWKNLILYGNALFQLNNVGLRSQPVPLVGVSYTF
jgi:Putative MetA-pathway of phenol degradation